MKPDVKKTVIKHMIILAGLAAYIAALIALRIYCPFRHLTGLPCPGCGMFRALIALLAGDMALSLALHPLLLPTCLGLLLLLHAKPLKLPGWLVLTAASLITAALLAVYFIRLAGDAIP